MADAKDHKVQTAMAKCVNTRQFCYHRGDVKCDGIKKVKTVKYDISRYGKHTECHTFDSLVTLSEAITYVEIVLSEPFTEAHYEVIKDDFFAKQSWTWENAHAEFRCRGDALGDCIFLESATVSKDGVLTFEVGS